ncbi:MAG: universal stress protein [Actinomycetota bacterium]|nr:universal stress protein [Actinomycetota bacterium]
MKILFPTDGSSTAEQALNLAITLAKGMDGEILVVSVNKFQPDLYGFQPGVAGRFEKELSTNTLKLAKEATKKVLDGGVKASYQTLVGDPSEKIVELAAAEKVDMIVMGTQGVTGLARVFIGSVADRVIRKAECPVVLVPNVGR